MEGHLITICPEGLVEGRLAAPALSTVIAGTVGASTMAAGGLAEGVGALAPALLVGAPVVGVEASVQAETPALTGRYWMPQ